MKDAVKDARIKADLTYPTNEPYGVLYWLELDSAIGRRIKKLTRGELKRED